MRLKKEDGTKVHPTQKNKDRPAKNVMRVAYGKKIGMFKSSILSILKTSGQS